MQRVQFFMGASEVAEQIQLRHYFGWWSLPERCMHNITTKDEIYDMRTRYGITKHYKTRVQAYMWKGKIRQAELPSEPPHDDKKPKDEDEEDYVPQPSTPLTPSHIIHASKRASENARRFRKRIVLHCQLAIGMI
jgi:hypothetical protein